METFEKSLLGSVALSQRLLTREQLDEALEVQAESVVQGIRPPRLGEILVSRGYLTDEQLRLILKTRVGGGRLFGEIVEAWGLCSGQQVDRALARQIEFRLQRRRPPRMGELLLTSGALKPHQIHAVLKAQGKQVVQCPGCSTSYNALQVKEGLNVVCPRCNTSFTPVSPPTGTTAGGEPVVNVRSDATAFLPAVEDEETQQRASKRLSVTPSLKQETQYRIDSRLGADASGLLYRAEDASRKRMVSLRIVHEGVSNGAGLEAWRVAADACRQLIHPHVQQVLSAEYDQGRVVIASEYDEGQSLRHLLQRSSKLEIASSLNILIQCAEALVYGLGRDVLHGDLRPSRVVLSPTNRVKVFGLGMPKQIHANLRMMTGNSGAVPLYAAPEVFRDGRAISARADVYSLCAMGYHMITGRAPQIASLNHNGKLRSTPPSLLAPHAIDPQIPPYISRMLLKGLAKNPGDRYASARELLQDLNTCSLSFKNRLTDVPAMAPLFDRYVGSSASVSRVNGAGGRHRRAKTAWRAMGGARLTLSDPPPATEIQRALTDVECQTRRSNGTCPATSRNELKWTTAHTGAIVAAAVVMLVCAVVLMRPASGSGTPPRSEATTQAVASANDDRAWRLKMELDESVLAYRRQHPEDFNNIRYHADQFVRKHEAKHGGTEPVSMARTIRLEQAKIGALKSRPALEKKIQDLLQQDRFKDALFEVSRWAGYWGKDATGAEEQVLRDHIRSEQNGHASAWLSQGQASRAEGAFDRARTLFNKVQDQFETEFAERARHEVDLTEEAELATKIDQTESLAQQDRARELAQRQAAAPVLLQKLVSDLQESLEQLNLPKAWRSVADAEPALVGTTEALSFEAVRIALGRIEGLLDRAVQAGAAGRLNDFTLPVQDWDGLIVDATRAGPTVKSGAVQAVVAWSSLQPKHLSEVFERCTDLSSPEEVLDLALFHLYRGDPSKAQELLDRAQNLGSMVDHHREILTIMRWVVSSRESKVTAAERGRELVETARTRSLLKGMEWEIVRGRWTVNPDFSFEGAPDPGMQLFSLQRQRPTFERLEVEVRGNGDAVGFSFGKGQRYLIRPIPVWQKVSLHRLPGNQLEMRVDGERRDSIEALNVSSASELPGDLHLRGQGTCIEFRNFSINGQVVRQQIGSAPAEQGVVPAVQRPESSNLDSL